eukprot:15831836-Heterocapsa_arctica.AAC.1
MCTPPCAAIHSWSGRGPRWVASIQALLWAIASPSSECSRKSTATCHPVWRKRCSHIGAESGGPSRMSHAAWRSLTSSRTVWICLAIPSGVRDAATRSTGPVASTRRPSLRAAFA